MANTPVNGQPTDADVKSPDEVAEDPVLARLYQEVVQCLGAARRHAASAEREAHRAQQAAAPRGAPRPSAEERLARPGAKPPSPRRR